MLLEVINIINSNLRGLNKLEATKVEKRYEIWFDKKKENRIESLLIDLFLIKPPQPTSPTISIKRPTAAENGGVDQQIAFSEIEQYEEKPQTASSHM